mgnify:FL=1
MERMALMNMKMNTTRTISLKSWRGLVLLALAAAVLPSARAALPIAHWQQPSGAQVLSLIHI